MLFSGGVRVYKCTKCASEYSDVTPTSLLPMAVVVGLTSAGWTGVFSNFVPNNGLTIPLGVILGIASLWFTYAIVDALTTRKLRKGICPKCGAAMTRTAGGFYDGMIPNPWELLIYALTIALPFIVTAAVRAF
jgi:hypothetical protein